MPAYPPFMNAYGKMTKILEKIQQAKTPDRFTNDFLKTKLGFKSSSDRAFIALAKRIGLLESDGAPTKLYKNFRNPTQAGGAIARAMRKGYTELYARNEFAHILSKKELEGLVIEITGLKRRNATLAAIVGTFEALKSLAKFDEEKTLEEEKVEQEEVIVSDQETPSEEAKLNLAYTINLVLPKTDDVAIFNAIFKSLRENLLRK